MSLEDGKRYVGAVIDGPNAGSRLVHYQPKYNIVYRQQDGALWEISYLFTPNAEQPKRSNQIAGIWSCGINIVRNSKG